MAKSDWGKPMPTGWGRGVAVHAMTGSYVAQVAEVSVIDNVIRVHRVTCGVDAGVVINPDTLAAQVEGGVIYGLTCALKNEITIAGGRVEQDNFNNYPMLRINEAPRVEVFTVPSTRLYSNPPLVFQRPFAQCTVITAVAITETSASAASGVSRPAAKSAPPSASAVAAITAQKRAGTNPNRSNTADAPARP